MASVVSTFDQAGAKVTLAYTFASNVTVIRVVRIATDGSETILRAGDNFTLTAGKGTIEDHEAPFDVAISYRADQVTPVGAETVTTAKPQTLQSFGRTWLKDPASPADDLQLNYVQGLPTATREARAGVFNIIDRRHPIVVSAVRQGMAGDLTLHTYTQSERDKLLTLVRRGQILLLASPPAYGLGSAYVHIGDVVEERVNPVATEWLRRWTLPCLMVDRPTSLIVGVPSERWQDVRTSWATLNDLYSANLTWDQLKVLPAGSTAPS